MFSSAIPDPAMQLQHDLSAMCVQQWFNTAHMSKVHLGGNLWRVGLVGAPFCLGVYCQSSNAIDGQWKRYCGFADELFLDKLPQSCHAQTIYFTTFSCKRMVPQNGGARFGCYILLFLSSFRLRIRCLKIIALAMSKAKYRCLWFATTARAQDSAASSPIAHFSALCLRTM